MVRFIVNVPACISRFSKVSSKSKPPTITLVPAQSGCLRTMGPKSSSDIQLPPPTSSKLAFLLKPPSSSDGDLLNRPPLHARLCLASPFPLLNFFLQSRQPTLSDIVIPFCWWLDVGG